MSMVKQTSMTLVVSLVGIMAAQPNRCLAQTSRPTASTPDNWVKRLTTVFNDRKKIAGGKKSDNAEAGTAILVWIQAVNKQFPKGTPDMLKHPGASITNFEPLWKGNKLQRDLLNRYTNRIQYVSLEEIEKWKRPLAKGGDLPKNGQVLFYLITLDMLYDSKGLKSKEVDELLKRLESLTDAQIDAVAQAVGIEKPRAAIELAQESWLFNDLGIDVAAYDAAIAKLTKSIKSKE